MIYKCIRYYIQVATYAFQLLNPIAWCMPYGAVEGVYYIKPI